MRVRASNPIGGQRGFTMLEILVTLFLLTMWLLASAGVQSSTLQFTKAAQFRTQAVHLATEISERMQANKAAAVAGSYNYAGGDSSSSPASCTAALCNTDQLAAFDLAEWSARVAAALPSGTATITNAGVNNPISYQIVISWTDRRGDRTYSGSGSAETFTYTSTKTIFNPPT